MARPNAKKSRTAISTLAGRSVQPMTALVDEADKQEKFLSAYAECGLLMPSLLESGVTETRYGKWMREDETFVSLFKVARAAWADKIRAQINLVALEGAPEPVVYKGQIQYVRDEDGELVYDKRGHKIPVTVPKRDNRVLLRLAEANLDEFAKGRHGGDHAAKPTGAGPANINIHFITAEDGRPAEIKVEGKRLPDASPLMDVPPEDLSFLD